MNRSILQLKDDSRIVLILTSCIQVKKSKIAAGGAREGEEFAGFVLGDRMREAVFINLGLLALKKCIEALNNKLTYVPFQDSKLTMLLSEGLGGDCKTSVIVCGNMEPRHASETMAALRFGERCSLVETQARNQASVLAGVLNQIEKDIRKLEVERRALEKLLLERIRLTGVVSDDDSAAADAGGVGDPAIELVGKPKYGLIGFGGQYAEQYGLGKKYDMN